MHDDALPLESLSEGTREEASCYNESCGNHCYSPEDVVDLQLEIKMHLDVASEAHQGVDCKDNGAHDCVHKHIPFPILFEIASAENLNHSE
jgi:hypothetical protein